MNAPATSFLTRHITWRHTTYAVKKTSWNYNKSDQNACSHDSDVTKLIQRRCSVCSSILYWWDSNEINFALNIIRLHNQSAMRFKQLLSTCSFRQHAVTHNVTDDKKQLKVVHISATLRDTTDTPLRSTRAFQRCSFKLFISANKQKHWIYNFTISNMSHYTPYVQSTPCMLLNKQYSK